jgi:hypothetical protein
MNVDHLIQVLTGIKALDLINFLLRASAII